jgi:hypothetical protein
LEHARQGQDHQEQADRDCRETEDPVSGWVTQQVPVSLGKFTLQFRRSGERSEPARPGDRRDSAGEADDEHAAYGRRRADDPETLVHGNPSRHAGNQGLLYGPIALSNSRQS